MEQEPGRVRAIVTFEGTIIRCGCGDPASHPGTACPTPRVVQALGELSRAEVEL